MDVGPLSRRKLLAVAGTGAVALGVAGCTGGGGSDAAPVPTSGGPASGITFAPPGPGTVEFGRTGGSIVTAWTSEANSYDSALGYDLQSWEAITSLLYTPLYRFEGEKGGPAPAAAISMPKMSKDLTTYVISLRPDFKFHHGRRIVADDYVYALTRVIDPDTQSWASTYLLGITGAQDFVDGKASRVDGLVALDDHTLEITLDAPDVTFTSILCQPYTAPLPKEEVQRLGKSFTRTPVGNGPYKVAKYDAKNRNATFERNPYFPWRGMPFVDKVVYRWGIVQSLQFLQLQKGDLDVLGEGLAPAGAARIQAKPKLKEKFAVTVPTLGMCWAAFNVNNPELSDPRVRQALNWATDRDHLARQSRGLQTPWGAALPKDQLDYTRTAKPYALDIARAKSLMKEAGASSLRLELLCSDEDYWKAASQILQQQWEEIGVKLKITTLSSSAFWDAVGKGKGDLFGQQWYQVQPSGLDIISSNFVSDGDSNYNGYSNPEVDALAKRARETATLKESNVFLAQAEEVLTEDAPGVFIGGLNFIAMRAPEVRNYQFRSETGTYYDRLWV